MGNYQNFKNYQIFLKNWKFLKLLKNPKKPNFSF